MTIRPATPSDLPAIQALHLASWRDSYAGMLPDDFLGEPVTREMARLWSGRPGPGDLLLVAWEDDLLGFAYVKVNHADGPLLDNLHVSPKARGRGIGERLLRAVAGELQASGRDRLWLEVLDENSGARRFYRRMGGVEGPVFMDEIFGLPVPSRKVVFHGLGNFFD
ncbi:hypothetical protein AVO45_02170 [Ruegeria marisrubri]|uniref:N-acetyltransferase domain-containing protein n=1 Tax=Ruegeria marisrubri TaxID=1685379 RepID=A0A101CYZ8_9RHOB|nr:N-acetyltransferase [Ruegeria marisrubri]KUJ85810.1 hypothetical protein AVO45_02170 [Ruegeria marisrubri]